MVSAWWGGEDERNGALVSLAWRWVVCAGASGTPLMKEVQGGISWASMRWTRIRLGPLSSPHHPSRSLALTTSKLHILPICTWPQNMTPTMHLLTPNPPDNRTKLEVDGGPTHPPLGSSGSGQEVALPGPSCQLTPTTRGGGDCLADGQIDSRRARLLDSS